MVQQRVRNDAAVALRKASFRSWLLARQSVVVGLTCDDEACPLAAWLLDVYSVSFMIGMDTRRTDAVGSERRLPTWGADFVACLDFTYPFSEVTGEQALFILDALEVFCKWD